MRLPFNSFVHRIHLVGREAMNSWLWWVTARCFGWLNSWVSDGGPEGFFSVKLEGDKGLAFSLFYTYWLWFCLDFPYFGGRPLQQWQQKERQSRLCSCVLHFHDDIHITLTRETGFGLHGQAPWSVLHLALIWDHRGSGTVNGPASSFWKLYPFEMKTFIKCGTV